MNNHDMDLEKGPKTRTSAIPNGNSQRVSDIPGITLDSSDTNVEVAAESKERVSMIPGVTIDQTEKRNTREVVNISDIKPEVEDNSDIPGVTLLESPQAEILKPGGVFDKYVKEKTQEMKERMAEEYAKRELEESEDSEDEESTEEVDEDEKEILEGQDTYDYEMGQVNVKGVSRDENNSNTKTKEDNETPFYQAAKEAGFKDDYQYPEEYGDLPIDEDESFPPLIEFDPEVKEKIHNILEEVDNKEIEERKELKEIMDQRKLAQEASNPSIPSPAQDEGFVEEQLATDIEDRIVNSKKVKFVGNDNFSIDDLEKEIENDSEGPTEDERLEELKAQITEKIKPKTKVLNLQGWTIASKATVSNKILETSTTLAGKWVLPATGICIQMREVSGQTIEKLRENMGNTASAARERLKIIYNHIISPKPESFEAWTKSTAFADYDHLFMPMYLAAFSDSNYMPQTCVLEKGKLARKETGCGKMFLSDNIDIMKCVKFKDDDSKKNFWDLYDSDRTNSEGLYASEVIPISENFAIAFQEPTLYGVLLEAATYGRDFATKYNNIISFIPYIADIYWLDKDNKKLVRVAYKEYDNNAAKTAKSKVIRYSNVLNTLSTDEYMNVVSLINAINEKFEWMTYQIPEMTCPECGRVIPAEDITASSLVFTRHRLGILANTSIN